ncbi:Uncharacterised protein [Mycobacteroides abscessus subsp. abscessus]|nr:Uncharacterised protein [Mycobacteroides abscessus subsp. abscessus]SIN34185.1 Uncharacterised protein [Mycobacteroides abscessus subsp. abscessus]SKN19861.1 Uncharacterised protein [Mycobacteroides abscessus subsp. massiliense]
MMTVNGSTNQCNCKPRMCSHSSTDRPNDAPSDIAMVPTIVNAATMLRVMTSMITKIRHSDAMTAIIRSYFTISPMS